MKSDYERTSILDDWDEPDETPVVDHRAKRQLRQRLDRDLDHYQSSGGKVTVLDEGEQNEDMSLDVRQQIQREFDIALAQKYASMGPRFNEE